MAKLKLLANDAEDLEIISAAVQDAIVNMGGIYFDKPARALTLRMSRYAHESKTGQRRVEAGMRIDGVLSVQSREIDRSDKSAFAVILKAEFTPSDAPAGELTVQFAGGGQIRVQVEALDVILADTDNTRKTKSVPKHDTDSLPDS